MIKLIVLVGNPNAGKTTLFNKLTHSNEFVGNFSGATVEYKKAKYKNTYIVDLPGIYSLIPYTNEEEVAINFLKDKNIDLIVNVIDANQINRSLYLTSRLLELRIPMMIVLTNNKNRININKLKSILGINVVDYKKITSLKGNVPNNLFGKNKDIYKDIESRYKVIDEICNRVIINNKNSNNILDNILLNKNISLITNVLLFIFIYYISINIIGNSLVDIISNKLTKLIDSLAHIINNMNTSIIFKELITKGILAGISNILSFIPIILILTFIISLLEDSGYITRMSLIFDRFLRIIGLSGKSFVPLLLGSTCSVLGIMNTRTIKDKKERLKAIFLIPFIPCSAKITVMIYIITIYFHKSFIVFLSFYIVCILVIIISSFILKNSSKSFIIDIPRLKVPSIRLALKNTYSKIKSFLFRIITVIMFVSIINYFLFYNTSILLFICDRLRIIFKIFTNEEIVSIISGFIAKEQVISTLNIVGHNLNKISSYIFCIFNVLTIPCINTISVIKKECGYKYMIMYLSLYLAISYIVTIFIYLIIYISY